MRGLSALVALSLLIGLTSAACAPVPSDGGPEVPSTKGAVPSEPSGETTPARTSGETRIAPGQFGSRKDSWHDALVSVTARGDVLLVRVTRDVTDAEIDDIKRAGVFARNLYGLRIEHVYIIFDDADSLLSYGPLE